MTNNRPLTTTEIAQHCHVTHRAVLKWIAAGKLKAYRTPGMHARVQVEDFINFLKGYGFPIPEEFMGVFARRRVLIVDDDRELAGMVRRILLLQKVFDVEVAYDGFAAGLKFSEFKPDLMIVDILMPQMNGLEVLKMIREKDVNRHVKILSVSGDEQELLKAAELGANDILAKPFDNKMLMEKVNVLMGIRPMV